MALIIPPNSSSPSLNPQLGLNQAAKTTGKDALPALGQVAPQTQAKDDGGLAVSDALRIQVRSLASAERSANDVISMAHTANGALGEMGGLLERMRDLALEDTGKLTDQGRHESKTEFSKLQALVDGIQKSATYDGRALLGTKSVEVGFDVGIDGGASGRLAVTLGGLGPLTVLATGAQLTGGPGRAPQAVVGRIDDALAAIADQRARFSAAVNRFADTAVAVQTARASQTEGGLPIDSGRAAEALANLIKGQIVGQGQAALLTQANQLPAHAMSLLQD
jgi:flagellin